MAKERRRALEAERAAEQEIKSSQKENRAALHSKVYLELQLEAKSGNDYLGISHKLRGEAEVLFSEMLLRPLNEWGAHEVNLYKLLESFPERQRYFSLISETKKLSEEAEGGNDKHILAELKKLNALMEALVQGQGKQIGMSKDNQNAAKIGIAAHLLTGGTAGAVARGIEDVFDSDEE